MIANWRQEYLWVRFVGMCVWCSDWFHMRSEGEINRIVGAGIQQSV